MRNELKRYWPVGLVSVFGEKQQVFEICFQWGVQSRTYLTTLVLLYHALCLIENRGGGAGGLNLPLPVPFNPSSRPVFDGSPPLCIFSIAKYAQCCVIFPFSPASRPLFSRLPYSSSTLFSWSPAPLFPSTKLVPLSQTIWSKT